MHTYNIITFVIETATSCDVSRTVWRLVFNNIRCSPKINLLTINYLDQISFQGDYEWLGPNFLSVVHIGQVAAMDS